MEMGGCVMRTAILGGMLLLASLCGEAAWTPGQFWVYEVRGTVPLWCPSLSYPGSFSHSPSMETVYVLRVSEDMVVLGIVALGQGRMAVCVVPVRRVRCVPDPMRGFPLSGRRAWGGRSPTQCRAWSEAPRPT